MPRLRLRSRKDPEVKNDPLVQFMYTKKFGERDPITDAGTAPTGSAGNFEAVFAHSPDVLEHCVQGFYLKQTKKRKLPLVYMELAITRVGWNCSCVWMYTNHAMILRAIGTKKEAVDAIPQWQTYDGYSKEERAVLAFADCFSLDHGRTPEVLFDQLKSYFTEEQIIELVYITGMFMMNAHMIKCLRLEDDDYDEIVKEKPLPPGYVYKDVEPPPLPKRS